MDLADQWIPSAGAPLWRWSRDSTVISIPQEWVVVKAFGDFVEKIFRLQTEPIDTE